jgi:hypothetical protein
MTRENLLKSSTMPVAFDLGKGLEACHPSEGKPAGK